jgi:hypothetical protein
MQSINKTLIGLGIAAGILVLLIMVIGGWYNKAITSEENVIE